MAVAGSKFEDSLEVGSALGVDDVELGDVDRVDPAVDETGVNDVIDVVTVNSNGAESKLGSDFTGEAGLLPLVSVAVSVMSDDSKKKQ